MESLEWKPEYAIGIRAVDHEHQALIEAINSVLMAMSLEGKTQKADLDGVTAQLGAIHGQTAAHFALEEKEMRDRQYPDYARHKEDHEALLDAFVDILAEVETRDLSVLASELKSRLTEWFGRHFREEDAKLHAFLKRDANA